MKQPIIITWKYVGNWGSTVGYKRLSSLDEKSLTDVLLDSPTQQDLSRGDLVLAGQRADPRIREDLQRVQRDIGDPCH